MKMLVLVSLMGLALWGCESSQTATDGPQQVSPQSAQQMQRDMQRDATFEQRAYAEPRR